MKTGCPWECNNFFVSGTISLCQAHPSWVSTSLTQFALSVCLPSPPGEWEPLFPGPAQMPLLWSFLSPRFFLCSAPSSWYSTRVRARQALPCFHALSPVRLWAMQARAAPDSPLWHSAGHTVAPWLCLLPDHRTIHWRTWLSIWLWPPALWLTAAGCHWGSFLTLPWTQDVLPSSLSHLLLLLLLTVLLPRFFYIDFGRKFLLLAEWSSNKVSLERQHGSRRARWGLGICLPPGITTYQLCDFGQVSLTLLCLRFLSCRNGNGNTCFSGLLGRLMKYQMQNT